MNNKSRQYKRKHLRRLDTLSGNQCAAPGCMNRLIARDGETIISKICHIEAACPGGPRYNESMTDDERRHYDNLILLCDACHSMIDNKDNETKYTVELLKSWKYMHENAIRNNELQKRPMLINQAINAIAALDIDDNYDKENENFVPFEISGKIDYNAVRDFKPVIEEYCLYIGKIDALYAVLENQGSFKKQKLLRNIKMIYTQVKGEYINGHIDEFEMIKNNADNIINAVQNKLFNLIDKKMSNTEDIAFALPVIIVDAFMRCKILENPAK